eukprot:GFUD01055334.1.p2 GENE.GFUD01055334.1~~GFUD01055334.1.p2  ORF type:complete len:119 (+),score=18.47 GFUD01055334.1:80-436(+)
MNDWVDQGAEHREDDTNTSCTEYQIIVKVLLNCLACFLSISRNIALSEMVAHQFMNTSLATEMIQIGQVRLTKVLPMFTLQFPVLQTPRLMNINVCKLKKYPRKPAQGVSSDDKNGVF